MYRSNNMDVDVSPFSLSRYMGLEEDQHLINLLNEYDPLKEYYDISSLVKLIREDRNLNDFIYGIKLGSNTLKNRKTDYYDKKRREEEQQYKNELHYYAYNSPPKFEKEPPPIPISVGKKYIFPETSCRETAVLIGKKESKLLSHLSNCSICQEAYGGYQRWYKNIIECDEVLRKCDAEYQDQRIEFICNREEYIKDRVDIIKSCKKELKKVNIYFKNKYIKEEYKDIDEIEVYANNLCKGFVKIMEYVEKKYCTNKIVVKKEYENYPLALSSDPHVTITIKDIFHLLKYSIELGESQNEWDKHVEKITLK